jgi:hypothetical protein
MRQLVGEAVLEYSAEDGFIIPRVTVRRLRDLYGWVALLTNSATDGQAKGSHLEVPALSGASDVVATTESLFVALAHTMQNDVFASAIENVNDRLRAARHLEALVFRDIAEEISALVASAQADLTSEFRKALGRYNKRRFDAVSQIVVLFYQDRRP